MTSVYVHTQVEVDLSEIDTDDLVNELESRAVAASRTDSAEDITEMFYAFHLGKPERAMELARKIAQDVTGRTLA